MKSQNGPPMPAILNPPKKGAKPNPRLRGFKATFFVLIDEDQLEFDDDDDEKKIIEIQTGEIQQFLEEAVKLDVDMEECGNPVGWDSIELHYDTLTEMTPKEMVDYYGR